MTRLQSDEPMRVHLTVTGPLSSLDDEGDPTGTFAAYDSLEPARAHHDRVGTGAGYLDRLIRRPPPPAEPIRLGCWTAWSPPPCAVPPSPPPSSPGP